MRTISIFIIGFIFNTMAAQELLEKEVKSDVNEVTVFLKGAQVVRQNSVELAKGNTVIKFVNLSPFIDAKSVQVKAVGNVTVLSVNHQQNYLDKMEKSRELTDLEKQLETIDDKIRLENTYLTIIKEELDFMRENRNIGGKNEQISLTNLQQISDFYSTKLTSLKMKEIERAKTLKDLSTRKADLLNQINTLSSKKEFPTGEILVKVDAKQSNTYALELSYLVGNAGWFPSYDIRAKNINEPIQLIYKANVKQDTKVDWINVKLKFSSADPDASGIAPDLQTYYLNYNTLPPVYKLTTNSVRGKVMGSNRVPLPGANVVVEGTTIGAVADMEGNYSITVPNNSSQLTFSYIGYNSRTLPITGAEMNVYLEENSMALQEVAVMAYGVQKKSSKARPASSEGYLEDDEINIRGAGSIAIPTTRVENQTTVDFEIDTPYTINSDNKNYTAEMDIYNLPASYQYYCVPKINKAAFLIANIVDWEKYNLLEGEANVFFEGTYVGKTLLDVRYASDTLGISLGLDKKVSINREKIEDFTNKQFIGNKKEEIRAWKTTVRNNKNQDINIVVLDQVPVSTIEEIEVNIDNLSGAKHDKETGEISWEFILSPTETKELELKYSVKYPKNRNLVIE